MALGGQLQILTHSISDGAQLHAALESIEPGDGHASYGDLSRAIRALAETVHAPIDVHLYSDMQRTAMPANFADLVLPANVTLTLHPVANGAPISNWTIESIDAPAEVADPKDPKHSRVRAVVAGFGTPAASKTVSLVVNGKVLATRRVDVPANGHATVEFAPLDVNYGFNRCEVRVEGGDGLAADDAGVFVVRRSDPQHVLFVHAGGDARSAVYFGAALTAAAKASFVVQSVAQEQATDFDPSRFAFVVLSDSVALPAIFEHTLGQYVARGGNVFIALGTNAAHRARLPVWDGNVTEAHDYARDGGATVGQVDFTHPALLDSRPGRDNGGWAETKIFYASVVDPRGARVAARLSDGTPLVVEKQIGQGHVLLLASGLENLTNDLPLHPVFVAFVDRVARYLSGTERLSGSRLVDSYVQLRSTTAPASEQGDVEVVGPDGRRMLSLSEARAAQTVRLDRAGFYQIRLANGRDMLVGVNPDRRESNLQPIAEDVQRLWSGSAGSAASEPEAASSRQEKYRPVSLWWYVMLLALITALAETAFASRYMGTQREEI
jgi:hypothetical protein